jgi:hypothetical protein
MSMRMKNSKKTPSYRSENMRFANPAEATAARTRELEDLSASSSGLYSKAQNADLAKYLHDTEYNRSLAEGRTLHPQLGALNESEFATLRKIQEAYDQPDADVGKLPEEDVRTLQGLGFVKVKSGGRVVPGFVSSESREDSKRGYRI